MDVRSVSNVLFLSPWRHVALNDSSVVAVGTDITSSITTVVYMLGHKTGVIFSIVSSSALGLSAALTISRVAFHFVADADHTVFRLEHLVQPTV